MSQDLRSVLQDLILEVIWVTNIIYTWVQEAVTELVLLEVLGTMHSWTFLCNHNISSFWDSKQCSQFMQCNCTVISNCKHAVSSFRIHRYSFYACFAMVTPQLHNKNDSKFSQTQQLFIPMLLQQHVLAWYAIIRLTKNISVCTHLYGNWDLHFSISI
jgi:hypothetical protein